MNSIVDMVFEVARLMLGLMIAAFHQPIADFVLEHERVLIVAFRQRGIPVPSLTREMAHTIYFALGIFIVLLEIARIWLMLHPLGH